MRQTFSRWQGFGPLWHQLQNLQHDMGQFCERLEVPSALRSFATAYPAINVWEEGDNVWVEAELPGMAPADIEINVTGGDQLTLKGERKTEKVEKAVVHRQERTIGKFARSLQLPFQVDEEKVDARFENGVLRIQLTKHERARPRRITVKGE